MILANMKPFTDELNMNPSPHAFVQQHKSHLGEKKQKASEFYSS
jgi:hypothetical protein